MSHGNKEDYTIPALKDLTGFISCEPLQVSKVLSHLLEGKSPIGVHAMQVKGFEMPTTQLNL